MMIYISHMNRICSAKYVYWYDCRFSEKVNPVNILNEITNNMYFDCMNVPHGICIYVLILIFFYFLINVYFLCFKI